MTSRKNLGGGNIVNSTSYTMGVVAVDKDGNLYSYGMEEYSGFEEQYEELTKIDGIKDLIKVTSKISNRWFLALTKDGTVYTKGFDEDFEKVMDNCKDIVGEYIITNDDVVYRVGSGTEVTEIGKSVQISDYNDPRHAEFISDGKIVPILWDGEKSTQESVDTYYKQYPTGMKHVFYSYVESDLKNSDKKILKLVYENNAGEVVLYRVYDCYNYEGKTEITSSKVSRSIGDIAKIMDFIKYEK